MKIRFMMLILMLAMSLWASAQGQVKISGTVTDAEGEPLIGVSVIEKGNSLGVTTDLDGKYEIAASIGGSLVFSYIGYETVERKISKAGVIDVRLDETSTALNEMVVVGYGVQKKSSVTGAISQVKAEDTTALQLRWQWRPTPILRSSPSFCPTTFA